ncbi:MAG: DsbA family protein [Acetobacter sp.]|nr:DsbA family protein [Acetobacter sp.]
MTHDKIYKTSHTISSVLFNTRAIPYLRILNMAKFILIRFFIASMTFFFAIKITPARAHSTSFTPAQRAEIVSIMREALKNDPSILSDAITALQNKVSDKQTDSALEFIRNNPDQFRQSTTDIVLGNPHGTLSLVEFYDPRCTYCRKILPDLKRLVADEPQLRLVEKVIPALGANSVIDAEAVLAAGLQHAYLKFQKALMFDTTAPGIERIRRVAIETGLNPDRLVRDMKSPAVISKLANNMALARAIGLDGTPTFIIGDQTIIPGAVSLEELKDLLSQLKQNTQKP